MQLATAKHLDRQRAKRDVFVEENARRSRSGLDLPFLRIPAERDLIAAAEAAAQREADFNASAEGELTQAIVDTRTALRGALMQLEAVDTARLRGDGSLASAADRLVLMTRPVLAAALDVSLAASAVQ